MAEEWFWVVVAACEVLLVLVILLGIAWLSSLRARRRDRKAITALVKRIKKQRSARVGQLAAFLAERHGLSGSDLNDAVTSLYKAEVGLLQAFVMIYGKRNADAVVGFEAKVENATAAYWELSGSGVDGAAAEASESLEQDAEVSGDDLDDGEVDRLRGENARLSDELRVTMDTMSRMLSEYSTVFTTDGEGAQVTVVDDGDAGDSVVVSEGDAIEPVAAIDDAAPPATAPNPDDILADMGLDPEPAPAADVEDAAAPVAAAAPNPDDILADMGLDPEPADVADSDARFDTELDEAARDLSDEDAPEDEAARAKAERQRIIDAES